MSERLSQRCVNVCNLAQYVLSFTAYIVLKNIHEILNKMLMENHWLFSLLSKYLLWWNINNYIHRTGAYIYNFKQSKGKCPTQDKTVLFISLGNMTHNPTFIIISLFSKLCWIDVHWWPKLFWKKSLWCSKKLSYYQSLYSSIFSTAQE